MNTPINTSIAERLQQTQQRIADAAQRYTRSQQDIQLIAVSKTQPAEALRTAYLAGQTHFGENYLQEALEKIDALKDYPLTWHFIGSIQSNKTKTIAEHFDWVHSVDRLKIATRLNDARATCSTSPLNICLQINISEEQSKSGISLPELKALAHEIQQLTHLKLRGLMALPAPHKDFEQQRTSFAKLKELQLELNECGFALDTLSMGMSNDLEAAIAEGATMVRIGSAIFGPRAKPAHRG